MSGTRFGRNDRSEGTLDRRAVVAEQLERFCGDGEIQLAVCELI